MILLHIQHEASYPPAPGRCHGDVFRLAEWWHGRSAVCDDILAASRIVASLKATQAAGGALGKMRNVDASLTIDAIVMATAALNGAIVVTGAPDDFVRLSPQFPRVAVLSA